jgi:hypothetical protein
VYSAFGGLEVLAFMEIRAWSAIRCQRARRLALVIGFAPGRSDLFTP